MTMLTKNMNFHQLLSIRSTLSKENKQTLTITDLDKQYIHIPLLHLLNNPFLLFTKKKKTERGSFSFLLCSI